MRGAHHEGEGQSQDPGGGRLGRGEEGRHLRPGLRAHAEAVLLIFAPRRGHLGLSTNSLGAGGRAGGRAGPVPSEVER